MSQQETFYQHCLRRLSSGDSFEELKEILEQAATDYQQRSERLTTKEKEE